MSRPPLADLRVLAVSQFGAGPFGTTVLADLGAEVIKIEDPAVGGDVSRYVPPWASDGDSLYFQSFNRGKKSLTLNLQHPEGQIIEVTHPTYGTIREVASPIKMEGAITAPAPAPRLGADTDEILRELLQYPEERIAALRASGLIGETSA